MNAGENRSGGLKICPRLPIKVKGKGPDMSFEAESRGFFPDTTCLSFEMLCWLRCYFETYSNSRCIL